MEIKVFIIEETLTIPPIYLSSENVLDSEKRFIKCFRGINSKIVKDVIVLKDTTIINIWVYHTREDQRNELIKRLRAL